MGADNGTRKPHLAVRLSRPDAAHAGGRVETGNDVLGERRIGCLARRLHRVLRRHGNRLRGQSPETEPDQSISRPHAVEAIEAWIESIQVVGVPVDRALVERIEIAIHPHVRDRHVAA